MKDVSTKNTTIEQASITKKEQTLQSTESMPSEPLVGTPSDMELPAIGRENGTRKSPSNGHNGQGYQELSNILNPSLLESLQWGNKRVACSFAGQGVQAFPVLERVLNSHPSLRVWVTAASDRIERCLEKKTLRWSGFYTHGFSLLRWLDQPESRPSEAYLASSVISQPLIFIAQIVQYQDLYERGLKEAIEAGSIPVWGGHSQGMMPALLVAEGLSGAIGLERFQDYVEYMVWQGLAMAQSYRTCGQAQDQAFLARIKTHSGEQKGQMTPMAAVSGIERPQLELMLQAFQRSTPKPEHAVISLYNTRTRHVLSGPVATLEQFRQLLEARSQSEMKKKKEGLLGGSPLQFSWEYLLVAAAYHSPFMNDGLVAMKEFVKAMGFKMDASALQVDVIHPATGKRFNDIEDLTDEIVVAQFVRSVNWVKTSRALAQYEGVEAILDLGPGDGVMRLSRSALRGYGVDLLALDTVEGQRLLFERTQETRRKRPIRYASFSPRLVLGADGRQQVDNRYTRATGHGPIILPGMTPTTSDVPIVAAAANAGFTAELAGGGQVSEDIFWKRMEELQEALEPGREFVFNALFLDPYLWNLHLGRQGLVQKARKAGFPICGVTITAGLPELDDAVRLLDELNAAGMWLNAFKPGTVEQVQQVIKIAKAVSDRPYQLFVHLEGGKAGGHHSWEDLDQLLLASYHSLRMQDNIVLCVGGGVADEARGVELLSGQWALAYEQPAMPVDAVFLGTLAMACQEAMTSPQVKQALVDAAGDADWVFAGGSKGGMTSGKSALNADIHYIDNIAARCGRLLDQVAGDAEAVEERREEIIEQLNQTAKPYFGNLEKMTYAEVLERMVELMAIGSEGRYEDGIWPDVTFRQRFADFLWRTEERLCAREEGSFESLLSGVAMLDQPAEYLLSFYDAYPSAKTVSLHPSDRLFFIHEICARPGKPVNFIPVIDAHVRRWYKADSLWQAHDPRFSAEQVLIIPGPEAVKGLTEVDEPIASLLGRFESALASELSEHSVSPSSLSFDGEMLATLPSGLHWADDKVAGTIKVSPTAQANDEENWFSWVAESFQGQGSLTSLFVASGIFVVPGLNVASDLNVGKRSMPNPLRSMCRAIPGSSLRIGEDQIVYRLPPNSHIEEVRVAFLKDEPSTIRIQAGRLSSFTEQPVIAGDAVSFVLDLEVHTDERGFRYCTNEAAWSEAVRCFYQLSMFGQLLEPAPLFTSVQDDVVVSSVQAQAYTAITGGLSSASDIPVNFVFSLAWKPLFKLLSCDELAGGLFQLVHQENKVRCHDAWPIHEGEMIEVQSCITRVEDMDAGRQIVAKSELFREGKLCATLDSIFFIRGAFGRTPFRLRSKETSDVSLLVKDPATLRFLREHEWLSWDAEASAALTCGAVLAFSAEMEETHPRTAIPTFKANGKLELDGVKVAQIDRTMVASCAMHPLRALVEMFGETKSPVQARTSVLLASEQVFAPSDMTAFAEISGDYNPIHQQHLFAKMAGFSLPIVHGMWTAARLEQFVCASVAGGTGSRIRDVEVAFLAPIEPSAALVLDVRRTGVKQNYIEIEANAFVQDGDDIQSAVRLTAMIEGPSLGYVFPGQGIQRQGMGMEGYARSKASRDIWDRADAFTREQLGFSILQIVRDNPKHLRVLEARLVHPLGVLHLTQFTQVAMAVLAQAQVAELREANVMVEDAVTCGHSLGEYNALGAVIQVLPLESVVEIVYQRGQAMHQLVERDEHGESGYRMMVIRPHYAGLSHAEAETLVAKIHEETGSFLQIVNYNIRGRQYAVTGQMPALEALQKTLSARAGRSGKAPCVEVPGIDVPFHSSMLRDGVPNFRDTLRKVLPNPINYQILMGRYIPNLVPKPFNLSLEFVTEVAETSDSHVLQEVLASFEEWSQKPAELARVLLIELLAWQFASPVRWIETQELLLGRKEQGGLGLEHLIEVGVGYQPTLTNMAQYSLKLMGAGAPTVEIQNVEANFASVCKQDGEEAPRLPSSQAFPAVVKVISDDAPISDGAPISDEGTTPTVQVSAPVASVSAPTPQVSAPAASLAEGSLNGDVSTGDALRCMLALQGKIRMEQIQQDETIDDIFDGVSSRRNQLLLDLGAEFDMGPIDGANEKPLSELISTIGTTVRRYQAPGKYLLVVQNEAIRKIFGRVGLNRKELTTYLQDTFGLGDGLCEACFNTLALETRPGDSARGGSLSLFGEVVLTDRTAGLALLDQVVEQMGRSRGLAIPKRSAGAAGDGAVVDSAALSALEDNIFGAKGVLMNTARELAAQLGHDIEVAPELSDHPELAQLQDTVSLFEAEHGREYADWIKPRFEAEKHVALTSVWAFSKRDVAKFFYDAMNHRLSPIAMAKEAARLSRHASNSEVQAVARWYADAAKKAGAADLSTLLEQIAGGLFLASEPFTPMRPKLSFGAGGCIMYDEHIDAKQDGCTGFVGSLWPVEKKASVHISSAATWNDEVYRSLLESGIEKPFAFQDKTALVTGASPDSIAIACVRHLLRGGAKVIVTTTSYNPKRMAYYRELYTQEAGIGAELHVVPFNQASFQDVESLVSWIFNDKTEQAGGEVRVLKRAWSLDLVLPFAAIKDLATLEHLGMKSNVVMRGMLLGVERLIASIATETIQLSRMALPCHILLPLSPNHGTCGGDGVYAETKAAMEVLLEKWDSEFDTWAKGVTFCGAQIGWVRGTGLMDDNNPVAAMLEEQTSVRTFSNEEMGYLLTGLLTKEARKEAMVQPIVADLTGGFTEVTNLKEVVDQIREEIGSRSSTLRKHAQIRQQEHNLLNTEDVVVQRKALSHWPVRHSAEEESLDSIFEQKPASSLERTIVVVGMGEVGPWGHAETRFEMEVDGKLSAGAVLELAWVTGLVKFEYDGRGGQWLDCESDEPVEEAEIAERYREAVLERGGIRWSESDTLGFDPQKLPVMATIFLEKDFSFSVASESEARSFLSADPSHTRVHWDESSLSWKVTRLSGAEVRVPRQVRLQRAVVGMIPKDFDFSRYGISQDMLERTDRVALFNLVATMNAFLRSGFTPEDLLRWIHPARVANTQGAGIGGMQSLHRLYLDHYLGEERQQDILQETLINVAAAHVVQSYVGSYGAMSHPVAACATAAVSLEEGFDKILAGKADFVVTGGFDDIGREGMVGFGDMHATADSDEMEKMGFVPSQMSRPNDVRRRGFVEAQGGGTLLLTRGDIARDFGLPVKGVLAYAGSFGDGLQKSIPAPGMGALASAMGGLEHSPLGRALSQFGLSADDIGAVSKHDTSTNANDKNENDLHNRIQGALGRTPGNPLFTISQKSLTGHAKGGSAAWQAIGLLQAMHKGIIPGNRNLECVDDVMKAFPRMMFTEKSIRMNRPMRAGMITSLGFGHVSGIALFVHRDAFLAQLTEEERVSYLELSQQRSLRADHHWAKVILGLEQAFDKRAHRRFDAADGTQAQAEEEAALLLNERARFDADSGYFV